MALAAYDRVTGDLPLASLSPAEALRRKFVALAEAAAMAQDAGGAA